MDVLNAGRLLEKEILDGRHGKPGSRFMGVRDIAAYTGCSYVTAVKAASWLQSRSLIRRLGNKTYVSAGRCAVESELEMLYKARRSPCMGILLPAAGNSFYDSMFECLRTELHARGMELFAAVHAADTETERRQLDMMLDMGMSGILFFSHRAFNNHRAFGYCPIPVVCLGRDIRGFTRSVVSVNNYDVGRLAALHLMEKGYRSFGYVGMQQAYFMKDMRLKGFHSTLKANGYTLKEESVVMLDALEEENQTRLTGFLDTLDEPAGIFCYHDLLAVACIEASAACGKRIPQEVGVIGCDDLPIASAILPSLTTVHYPYGSMAAMAVDLLERELLEGATISWHVAVKPRVIERESTRAGG